MTAQDRRIVCVNGDRPGVLVQVDRHNISDRTSGAIYRAVEMRGSLRSNAVMRCRPAPLCRGNGQRRTFGSSRNLETDRLTFGKLRRVIVQIVCRRGSDEAVPSGDVLAKNDQTACMPGRVGRQRCRSDKVLALAESEGIALGVAEHVNAISSVGGTLE